MTNRIFLHYIKKGEPLTAFHVLKMSEYYLTRVFFKCTKAVTPQYAHENFTTGSSCKEELFKEKYKRHSSYSKTA